MNHPRRFIKGAALIARIEVRDANGTSVDPANLVLRRIAAGAELAAVPLASLTKRAIGVYEYPFVANTTGEWNIRWESTTPDTADELRFNVADTKFTI